MDLNIMRQRVRRDLHDEDSQDYRWSDNELDRHIGRAVKEFSLACPREQKTTLSTTSGSRDISLSSLTDVVAVYAVEYPVDRFPRCLQRFSFYESTVTLLGSVVPDGSDCRVYYGRLHALDAQTSTIPAQYEDIVAAGAAAYAAMEWAVYTVNRVNVGGEQVPGDFLRLAQERLQYFKAELKRLKYRVRSQVLYKPGEPSDGKATDWGPR